MANPETPTRVVRCPRCRKSTRYDPTNPFRPFCSAACKNEDIIGWAEESYRIAGPPAEDGEREQAVETPGEEED